KIAALVGPVGDPCMSRGIVSISGAFVLSLPFWACGSSSSSTSTPTAPTPATPPVTFVSVTGAAPNVGASAQFTATATLSNGASQAVTNQATWQSSDSSVVTVNGTGAVLGVGSGEADVTASYQGVTSRAHVTIASTVFTVSGTFRDGTSNGILPGI